jgi:hypothetical protein
VLEPVSPIQRSTDDGRVIVAWSVPDEVGGDGILEITRVDAGGDTTHVHRLRYAPVAVPGTVADSLLEPVPQLATVFGVSAGELTDAMRSGMDLPEFRPPVRGAYAAADGHVWIELNGEATGSADWVVLDGNGTVIGRFTGPSGLQLRHTDGVTAWATATDELDIPWVVRFRVE